MLVYPSIHEGWGISILEANACGTVSVGSDVSGLKDSIRHNETGILYPLGNKARLTDALFDILTDKTKRHDMEQNAVEWSKKFNWEDSYKKMRSLIKQ